MGEGNLDSKGKLRQVNAVPQRQGAVTYNAYKREVVITLESLEANNFHPREKAQKSEGNCHREQRPNLALESYKCIHNELRNFS